MESKDIRNPLEWWHCSFSNLKVQRTKIALIFSFWLREFFSPFRLLSSFNFRLSFMRNKGRTRKLLLLPSLHAWCILHAPLWHDLITNQRKNILMRNLVNFNNFQCRTSPLLVQWRTSPTLEQFKMWFRIILLFYICNVYRFLICTKLCDTVGISFISATTKRSYCYQFCIITL